jgi:hypothetical protein
MMMTLGLNTENAGQGQEFTRELKTKPGERAVDDVCRPRTVPQAPSCWVWALLDQMAVEVAMRVCRHQRSTRAGEGGDQQNIEGRMLLALKFSRPLTFLITEKHLEAGSLNFSSITLHLFLRNRRVVAQA